MIYLACPYSHKYKAIRVLRHFLVTCVGAELIKLGHHIFSPITESHMYQLYNDQCGSTWEFWEVHDKMMMDRCDELWVLTLPGWKESKGVQAEILYAKQKNMDIQYIKLTDIIPELEGVIV